MLNDQFVHLIQGISQNCVANGVEDALNVFGVDGARREAIQSLPVKAALVLGLDQLARFIQVAPIWDSD